MADLFKKVIYTGVGLVAVTAEKLQETVDKLVEENKISREEGRKVVDELVSDTEEKRDEFESQLKSIVEKVFNSFKVVTQKDYDALLKRVEKLEGTEAVTEEDAATPAPRRKTAPKKKAVAVAAE